jgi:hypothetical protein
MASGGPAEPGAGDAGAESAFLVECARGADPREAIFRAAVERGWVLLELHAAKASLEDVFVRLTTRDAAAEGGEAAALEAAADADANANANPPHENPEVAR